MICFFLLGRFVFGVFVTNRGLAGLSLETNKHDSSQANIFPSPLPASQEGQADELRYDGLPSGDHSLVVEGLGQFAPTGSYAHSGNQRGLGDEEEEVRHPTFRNSFPLFQSKQGALYHTRMACGGYLGTMCIPVASLELPYLLEELGFCSSL